MLFALYFIYMELKQLMRTGVDYFTSFWNYLDIVPPILLIIFVILELNGEFDLIETTQTKVDPTTGESVSVIVKQM